MENKRRIQQLSSVEDPLKVKVLILTDQKTTYSDFYYITRFTNIVKLDLSYNKLNSFPVGFSFRSFAALRTLFLHYNKFGSIKSVQLVNQCAKLQYLTLFGNPLEQTKTRHYFVNQIPSLKLMDDKIVKIQQRNPQIILSHDTPNIKISFPIITVTESEGSAHFLSAVISELVLIRSKYRKSNPIIKIQRWYRQILTKNRRFHAKNNQEQFSQKIYRLETDEDQRKRKKDQRQRLITQKLTIHKSSQQLIGSLIKMNFQFVSFLKQKSQKKVFALKQFCEKHRIEYQTTSKKLYCLRAPNDEMIFGKNYLQYIVNSNQKYLLRRKGSEQSMNMGKKYAFLQKLIAKRKKRQPSHYKFTSSVQANVSLNKKLNELEYNYCNNYVLIKQNPQKLFSLMKQHYHASVKSNKCYPFCLEQIVERSAAAVSIQRIWRGSLVRKKINSWERIVQNNSAWLIQRFIRNVGFKQRHSMFINIIDYIQKQGGTNQIIIPMQDVFNIQKLYLESLHSINFGLMDQRVSFGMNQETENIFLIKYQNAVFSKLALKYTDFQITSATNQEHYHSQNALDLLFKGSKTVKYFNLPSKEKKQNLKNNSPQKIDNNSIEIKQKLLSKSKSKLNSQIIVKSNLMKVQQTQAKKNQQQIKQAVQIKNQKSYVLIQYKNFQQTINRKFMIALVSYKISSKKFIQSCKLNLNQNNTKIIKNINQQINQRYFVQQIPQQENEIKMKRYLQNRVRSKISKLKLFVNNLDLTTKVQLYYPVLQPQFAKRIQNSITLPIKRSDYETNRYSQNQQNIKSVKNEIRHSARISQNNIKIFPNQLIEENQSGSNFMSYRQFESKFNKKYLSIYDGSQNNASQYIFDQQKSLQKSQSLQPTKRGGQSNINRFLTVNENQKGYTTEHQMESVTESLRNKFKNQQQSIAYSSIAEEQRQNKKRKITLLKQSHKTRLEQNQRYKKSQLSKLRQKINDQLEINNRIMESNRLQGILSNARKHNRVKMALQQNLQQVQNFQRDFLKRGNSSIRKDMIKFQNDRSSSKSPDNQSIYDSMKSFQGENNRSSLRKKSQRIFNLKTQIKQFSIDASEGDQEMSLGALQGQNNKSKFSNRKPYEQQKVYRYESYNNNQRQMSGNVKSSSKDLKKKRLVHSVFPQQFYPLKQSKKIGFQLPRISKK